MTEQSREIVAGIDVLSLSYSLNRVATALVSGDPILRAESKRIAKNRLEDITNEISNEEGETA
jgi:hypothetical protein